jgi:K+-sensing histidine kinase KdpD
MAQKAQVTTEYEVAPGITTVVSDQGKLRQTLFNFIAWAVSRSPAGESVKITVDVDNKSMLSIRVRDNGEPKEISSVFDPENNDSTGEPNINELGIIIGRKLLELIGGTVTLQNCTPRGLEATITIPARPPKG